MVAQSLRRTTACVGGAFTATFIVGMALSGDAPEEKAPAAEVISFYTDHASQVRISAFLTVAAAVVLLFFGSGLRAALRGDDDGGGWGEMLATVVFGGAVAYAVGLAGFGVTSFAVVEAADLGQPEVTKALNVLDSSNFFPTLVGVSAMMVAAGIRSRQVRLLPGWLAWASIVIGALAPMGIAGLVAYMAFPLWVFVVGVTLARRTPERAALPDARRIVAA